MSDGLFDLEANSPTEAGSAMPAARDEQITAIRAGLDRANISTQDERREFVEQTVQAQISSLRDLTALQARRVIERLESRAASAPRSDGSLWDDRVQDTWIDKM